MARRVQKYQFGGGAVLALLGLGLLVCSVALPFVTTQSTLASNGPPLLFICAVIALRIGFLISERYLCSACGERVAHTSTQCPACDEPLVGF